MIGNYAFIVSEARNHGLQVYDLTKLRNRDSLVFDDEADFSEAGFGQAHNIVANEETGYVYVVGARYDNVPSGCNG